MVQHEVTWLVQLDINESTMELYVVAKRLEDVQKKIDEAFSGDIFIKEAKYLGITSILI
jgi:hypothetical protein